MSRKLIAAQPGQGRHGSGGIRMIKVIPRICFVMLLSGLLGATLVRFSPGFGVDERELDSRLSHESLQALRSASLPAKSLPSFYASYIQRMIRGDWGYSRSLQRPVLTLIAQRLPDTAETVGLGLTFSWSLGMILAIAPFLVRTESVEVSATLITGLLLCLPAGVLTLLCVLSRGPIRLVVGLMILPKVYRYALNILEQSAHSSHVLTAWAKGGGRFRVFFRHILPVAAPHLLAVGSISITLALAAAVPVEVVGDLAGIGQLAWKAALARDMELLVSLTLLVTFITLVANSACDLLTSGTRPEVS